MMIRSTGKFQYSPLENSADNSLLKVLPNRLPAQFWPHFSNLKTFPRQRKTNADSKSVPLWTFTCGSKVISRIKKIQSNRKIFTFHFLYVQQFIVGDQIFWPGRWKRFLFLHFSDNILSNGGFLSIGRKGKLLRAAVVLASHRRPFGLCENATYINALPLSAQYSNTLQLRNIYKSLQFSPQISAGCQT